MIRKPFFGIRNFVCLTDMKEGWIKIDELGEFCLAYVHLQHASCAIQSFK